MTDTDQSAAGMPNLDVGGAILPANVYAVFLNNGQQHIVLAKDDRDLPFPIADIAFAANMVEIETLLDNMRRLALGEVVGVTTDIAVKLPA